MNAGERLTAAHQAQGRNWDLRRDEWRGVITLIPIFDRA
jgi:hypothetical protein